MDHDGSPPSLAVETGGGREGGRVRGKAWKEEEERQGRGREEKGRRGRGRQGKERRMGREGKMKGGVREDGSTALEPGGEH